MNYYVNDFSTTVQTYYKELKKFKPLSQEAEKDLLKKIKRGNEQAKKIIIESHLRYVFNVAKEYKGKGVSMEDLISEGNVGLNKALDRFDNEKGVKFITYAVWWIKQSMQDCVRRRKKIMSNEIYEDDYFTDNDSVGLEMDFIEHKNYQTTTEHDDVMTELNEAKKIVIQKLLTKLPKKGQEIIKYYYGLENYEEKTLQEIGDILGLTKERVRQIKEKSLQILRSEILLVENFDDLFI